MMTSLLKFAASSQLHLPPAAASAATTSDIPIDDYIWYLIALVYIACLVIIMAVILVILICNCCRQNSPNNDSPISPEPQAFFMVVELTPTVPSKQGLKESALKALPKTRYEKAAADDIEDQAECVVCLTEFEEGKWTRKLPQCGHEFHVKCIDKWLRSQASCPSCRTEVLVQSSAPLPQEGCFDE